MSLDRFKPNFYNKDLETRRLKMEELISLKNHIDESIKGLEKVRKESNFNYSCEDENISNCIAALNDQNFKINLRISFLMGGLSESNLPF